jgi:hypothetical protein
MLSYVRRRLSSTSRAKEENQGQHISEGSETQTSARPLQNNDSASSSDQRDTSFSGRTSSPFSDNQATFDSSHRTGPPKNGTERIRNTVAHESNFNLANCPQDHQLELYIGSEVLVCQICGEIQEPGTTLAGCRICQ